MEPEGGSLSPAREQKDIPMDRALQQYILQHRHDDVRELMLGGAGATGVDRRAAAVQIAGWQIAGHKLPLWARTEGIIFPEHLALEQCSSQRTAAYKATLLPPADTALTMADLTGGFGVDSAMMMRGREGGRLLFVEQDAELCRLAEHNLPLLGVKNATIIHARAEEALEQLPHVDLLFMDPARRDAHGGRTVALADCSPNAARLMPQLLEKARCVLLKLSPMLDLTQAVHQLQGRVTQVHVVGVDGECKELLVMAEAGASGDGECVIHCVNLGRRNTHFAFTRKQELAATCDCAQELGAFLYEPDATVRKAAAFRSVALQFGLKPLHPNSHLYTADTLLDDFPGRAFGVVAVCPATKADVQRLLGPKPAANLTVRNFPLTTDALRKKLGLRDGGTRYLFATTLAPQKPCLVLCEKTAPTVAGTGQHSQE